MFQHVESTHRFAQQAGIGSNGNPHAVFRETLKHAGSD
jgi:hypothetical protein